MRQRIWKIVLVLQFLMYFTFFYIARYFLNFKRILSLAQWLGKRCIKGPLPQQVGFDLIRWIGFRYRDHNCFTLALLGVLWLTATHTPATFYIGIRKKEDQIEAHAWIELQGEIVVGELISHHTFSHIFSYAIQDVSP